MTRQERHAFAGSGITESQLGRALPFHLQQSTHRHAPGTLKDRQRKRGGACLFGAEIPSNQNVRSYFLHRRWWCNQNGCSSKYAHNGSLFAPRAHRKDQHMGLRLAMDGRDPGRLQWLAPASRSADKPLHRGPNDNLGGRCGKVIRWHHPTLLPADTTQATHDPTRTSMCRSIIIGMSMKTSSRWIDLNSRSSRARTMRAPDPNS
jgi:hypothetical protein